MLYSLLKIYSRLALRIYCRKVVVNRPEVLQAKGPLLLASNHPNSFLDGIILTTLFNQPVYSLARGDAFKKKKAGKLLRRLRLLPVYRTSEGVENLEHNYTTFAACRQVFMEGHIVLIFSEGRCENEWHLRPLRKGTARLALTSWEQGIPLQVIPTALNYSSFKDFGKVVHLYFGDPITLSSVAGAEGEGKKLLAFNQALAGRLQPLVYELDPQVPEAIRRKFPRVKDLASCMLMPFAAAGWLLHAPLYYPLRQYAKKTFGNSGHFDSVVTALLLLAYPVYLLLLLLPAYLFFSWPAIAVLPVWPFTAWACVRVKYALGR